MIPNKSRIHTHVYILPLISLPLCVMFGYLSLPTHTETQKCFSCMDSINRETETLSRIRLQEGIILLLSRWYALQMAVHNQWGGCDSLQKSHQLAADLFSFFSKSNGHSCVDFFFYFILILFHSIGHLLILLCYYILCICCLCYSTSSCWRFRKSTPRIHVAYI